MPYILKKNCVLYITVYKWIIGDKYSIINVKYEDIVLKLYFR